MRTLTLAAIGCLAFGCLPCVEARTWRDTAGKPIVDAELVQRLEGSVVVKKPDGRTLSVAWDRLSDEDRRYVEEQTTPASAEKRPSGTPYWETMAMVVRKPLDTYFSERDRFNMSQILLGTDPGIEMRLLLTGLPKQIVHANRVKSRLIRFTDDKGTDLLPSKAAYLPRTMFETRPHPIEYQTTRDGSACMVQLRTDATPAKGATRLFVEGEMLLFCSTGEKTVESEELDILAGATFKANSNTWTFTRRAGTDPMYRDSKMFVHYETDAWMGSVKKITFLTTGGDTIDHQRVSWRDDYPEKRFVATVGLTQEVPKLKVRIQLWNDFESVTVPLKIETGLGLP
jgi:hypothetical protein